MNFHKIWKISYPFWKLSMRHENCTKINTSKSRLGPVVLELTSDILKQIDRASSFPLIWKLQLADRTLNMKKVHTSISTSLKWKSRRWFWCRGKKYLGIKIHHFRGLDGIYATVRAAYLKWYHTSAEKWQAFSVGVFLPWYAARNLY